MRQPSHVTAPAPRCEPGSRPDDTVELTVGMPCLNEAATIETCIRKALSFFTCDEIRGEVVVGDNGSTDGSRRSPAAAAPASSTCLPAATVRLSTRPS